MTLFGNRVFAGIIRTRVKMRLYWISMGPKFNENVHKRDRKGYTETQRSGVMMKADTGVVYLPAKDCQGLQQPPEARRDLSKFSLRTSRNTQVY